MTDGCTHGQTDRWTDDGPTLARNLYPLFSKEKCGYKMKLALETEYKSAVGSYFPSSKWVFIVFCKVQLSYFMHVDHATYPSVFELSVHNRNMSSTKSCQSIRCSKK